MSNPTSITRTCSSCGLAKPLSAFLQLSGTHGTTYGNICATCRSKQAKSGVKPQDDEWSRASSGFRIGGKEKAYADEKKFRETLEKEHEAKEELKRRDLRLTEKLSTEEVLKKQDRERRQFFLDVSKPVQPEKKIDLKQIDPLTRQEILAEIKQVQEFLLQETKLRQGEIGYAPMALNELRYNTAIFLQFIDSFLTGDSPIKRFLNQHNKRPTTTFGLQPNKQAEENKRAAIEELKENLQRNYPSSSSPKKT